MTIPADPWWREFIAAQPARTAKLATVRADGRPHVAPVWVALDGDDVVFTTGAESVKGKALRRDPRVSLCLDDESPPYAFVLVEGEAALSEDLDDMLRWATFISGRYLGDDKADGYGRRNAVPGELLVRLRPAHVVAAREVA